MKKLTKLLIYSCFVLAVAISANAQSLTIPQIMAEPSIAGQRVSGANISPDGKQLVFYWNPEGHPRRNLYIMPVAGGEPRLLLSPSDLPQLPQRPQRVNPLDYGVAEFDEFDEARRGQLGGVNWSPDSKKLVFTHSGDIYVMTIADRSIKRMTYTQTPEMGARILDDDRIYYTQSGNTFILNTKDQTITQVNRQMGGPQQGGGGGGGGFGGGFTNVNDQLTRASFTVSDTSKHWTLIVPNFIPEKVTTQTIRRGWAEQKMYAYELANVGMPIEIKFPAQEGVGSFRRSTWSADGKNLIVDRIDRDTKRRQLFFVADAGTRNQKVILVSEHTDDKWQAQKSNIFETHPTNPNVLFFASEEPGYNHLFLATVDPQSGKVDVKTLTSGNWQVEWARWTNDGKVIFTSTESGYTERELYLLDTSNGSKQMLPSNIKGMKGSFSLSENKTGEQSIVYEFSQWNMPGELYSQRVCQPCSGNNQPVKLTNSVPDSFKAIKFIEPKFIEIPSRDGKKIPAKIYLPNGHSAKNKYPMAIFVHGAGYLQNVINGWNNYYREFMFNQILLEKGYVVLDIDFRGSSGYGRDWRTDVHSFLGGPDFEDHVDSIEYMVKNYGVDQSKVGAYGGSYGGFLAGHLAMRAPDHIAAAAALRPVFDYKNYYMANPTYTAQRLGFPEKNPEWYKRSAPINYADQLRRPLLILHGMVDDNVHVQDSIQLMEKLIRLGKTEYFEVMLYPSENHGFVRPESWTDEYIRIYNLFEKHVNRK